MENNIHEKEVLFITTSLKMGGVQTFLLNYIPFLIHCGIKVSIAIQTNQRFELHSRFEEFGCSIFSITPITKSYIGYMQDIKKILKENPNICAVYDNQNFLNIFSLWTARWCGVKVRISHSHSNYETSSVKRKIQRWLFKFLLPVFATHYWACSQPSAEWLYGRKARSNRCYIIANAIDDKRFSYDHEIRRETRKKMQIDDCFVAVHIGMFTDAKNHVFLLDVFAEYVKVNPNARLVLCGDGPLRANIELHIAKLGIQDSVLLQGMVLDTERYYNAADILLFPSKYEGATISVIEAQASGINCIVSKAVAREIVLNENVSCCDFDIQEWIDMIEKMRSKKIDRRAAGKKISRSDFSLSQKGIQFADKVKDLLQG